MMNLRLPVVVIGGGISGVSVAWWLEREGVDVLLLEKDDSVGGTMKTQRTEGWLVEHGPNSALETTPLLRKMFESLGILEERVYASKTANRRYILRNGTLHALPTSPLSFLKTDLWSARGKLRLLKEPFVGRAGQEESIAGFVERRLGREFLDYAIDPFVAGVYAGDPEKLSAREGFPKLYALEEKYGGLIKGMVLGARERKVRAEKAKVRAQLFSFRQGMEMFPSALAGVFGRNIMTGCSVEQVLRRADDKESVGYTVRYRQGNEPRVVDSAAVVVCVPAHAASGLTKALSPPFAQMLRGIHYPPVAEVFFGFGAQQVSRELDGFGFLVPEKEKRQILGSIWSSSLFEGRSPGGHVAMTTFVGGARQPELAALGDGALCKIVLDELKSVLGIDGEPVFRCVTRWEKAIPQYNLGHERVVESIERFEKDVPGVFICSNYRGGIAVGDCIMSSKRTATNVMEYLKSSHRRKETVESAQR